MRQIYDVTSLSGTLRYTGAALAVAIDSGGVHYETGGALVLRNVAGAVGASRVQQLDAQIGFGTGPVVRAASGSAVLALDELYSWAILLPGARTLRDDLVGLQGTAGLKSRSSPGRSTRRSAWTWMRCSRRRTYARCRDTLGS